MITNIVQLVMLLAPMVLELVQEAETIYEGAQDGKVKKDHVMNALGIILDGMNFFKEGTDKYKAMVLGVADNLIESAVSIYNLTGAWGRGVEIKLNEGDVLT